VSADLTLRWAALLHDTGKIPTFTLDENGRGHFYGHAEHSAGIADRILQRLNAPARLREDAVQLIELHMHRFSGDRQELRCWLSRLGYETMENLLILQEADLSSKGTGKERDMSQFTRLRQLIREIREESR
jgi:tRNA nucleotidyltransferase (CCA-adding enzyme)